ncbi:DUF4224 domain-containing protein [Chitinimonas sp. PSY-7]|uniref:DUF4224 domain-containing protein n=1 Tax=Chitinimonas sp. PSY-7 TaxID=3459088 RepID=UPI0040402597
MHITNPQPPINNRLFLTQGEMAELCGIKGGRSGLSRNQRQINWLRTSGIPFVVNAAGRPIVAVAAVTGTGKVEQSKPAWSPRALQKAA